MKTIKISDDAHKVWVKWCKVKGMGSEKLMDNIVKEVKMKHQQALYNSLPNPSAIKDKSLSGIKINKKDTFNR